MNLLNFFAWSLRKQKILSGAGRVVLDTHYLFTLMEVSMDSELLETVAENNLRTDLEAVIVCRLNVTGVKTIQFSIQTRLPGFLVFAKVGQNDSDWTLHDKLPQLLVEKYGFKQYKGMSDYEIVACLLNSISIFPEMFKK